MNLTLKHVIWCLGAVLGAVLGFVLAPSWEMAPFFVAFVACATGAISAQCAIYGGFGLLCSLAATVAGSSWIAVKADAPSWVIQRCVLAVCVAGLLSVIIGLGLKKRLS